MQLLISNELRRCGFEGEPSLGLDARAAAQPAGTSDPQSLSWPDPHSPQPQSDPIARPTQPTTTIRPQLHACAPAPRPGCVLMFSSGCHVAGTRKKPIHGLGYTSRRPESSGYCHGTLWQRIHLHSLIVRARPHGHLAEVRQSRGRVPRASIRPARAPRPVAGGVHTQAQWPVGCILVFKHSATRTASVMFL